MPWRRLRVLMREPSRLERYQYVMSAICSSTDSNHMGRMEVADVFVSESTEASLRHTSQPRD
jgi:hypothetical protein